MKKTTSDERGSALLLTLGILSLALIVAMAFAFSARLNRQIAKVNADQIKARLLAESALNLVVAAMMHEDDVYPPESESSRLFSNAEDYLPAFFVSDGDSEYDLSNDTHILPVLGQFATLPTPRFSTIEVDGETIGRVAFLVLEEGDKLDLNQMLTLSGKVPFVEAGETGENRLASFTKEYSETDFFYDILGDGTNDIMPKPPADFEYDKQTLRLGLQMQELRVASDYFTQLPSGYTSTTQLPSGYPGTKAKWFSYTHLWRKLWSSNAEDALRYTFFSGEDIEAYWDGSTERQRFDITGYEWRADGASSGWECPPPENPTGPTDPTDPTDEDRAKYSRWLAKYSRWLVDELTASSERPTFWDNKTPAPHPVVKKTEDTFEVGISKDDDGEEEGEEESAENGFGIPYLNKLEVDTPNHGKQIAANMVDFCDKDDFATTDATWEGTPPTYCGNEKVSYINEMYLEFSLIEDNGKYKLKLKPSLEMVNIYNENVPGGEARIRISGKVKFGEEKDWSYEISKYAMNTQGKLSYAKYDLDEQEVTDPATTAESAVITGELLVIIGVEDDIYDVAYCKITTENIVTVNIAETAQISLEVSDPRCNHRSDCWKISEPTNSIFLKEHPDDADIEDYENFLEEPELETESEENEDTQKLSTFSTAFIPNRPFRNFWELGAIHRGEPFRTLDIAGEDAEILDQVKIGPLKYSRGKFNANSRNPLAWAELLRGIALSAGYEDISYYDPADEDDPKGNYPPEPDFAGIAPSHSRAAVAAALASFGSTDREREALIGRTANLLTTRMDKYSVLVIGQALKKLDGVTGSNWDAIKKSVVNPIEYDGGYYSILATQRILAHIVRDAWRNEYKIVQLQIIED